MKGEKDVIYHFLRESIVLFINLPTWLMTHCSWQLFPKLSLELSVI